MIACLMHPWSCVVPLADAKLDHNNRCTSRDTRRAPLPLSSWCVTALMVCHGNHGPTGTPKPDPPDQLPLVPLVQKCIRRVEMYPSIQGRETCSPQRSLPLICRNHAILNPGTRIVPLLVSVETWGRGIFPCPPIQEHVSSLPASKESEPTH
ncbi:hypothetical protein EV126DRAFT_211183 [Verticillium dahliae]|nr:hypothetical protein EV126DRAFT_211183 [Verticillium dahliae]